MLTFFLGQAECSPKSKEEEGNVRNWTGGWKRPALRWTVLEACHVDQAVGRVGLQQKERWGSLISTACRETFGPSSLIFLGKLYKAKLHIRYQRDFSGLNSKKWWLKQDLGPKESLAVEKTNRKNIAESLWKREALGLSPEAYWNNLSTTWYHAAEQSHQ